MAGASDFRDRMRERGRQVTQGVNVVKRKTALAIHSTVSFATPVATGRARANWQVEIDATPGGVVGSPGARPTDAPDPLVAGRPVIESAQPGQAIHIANNLAYIVPLNEGHSAQAPAGFVQEAIRVGAGTLRSHDPILK